MEWFPLQLLYWYPTIFHTALEWCFAFLTTSRTVVVSRALFFPSGYWQYQYFPSYTFSVFSFSLVRPFSSNTPPFAVAQQLTRFCCTVSLDLGHLPFTILLQVGGQPEPLLRSLRMYITWVWSLIVRPLRAAVRSFVVS